MTSQTTHIPQDCERIIDAHLKCFSLATQQNIRTYGHVLENRTVVDYTSKTTAFTLLGTDVYCGVVKIQASNAITVTTPTAQQIINAFPQVKKGDICHFLILNTGSGTITLAAGTGVTLTSTNLTGVKIAAGAMAPMFVQFTMVEQLALTATTNSTLAVTFVCASTYGAFSGEAEIAVGINDASNGLTTLAPSGATTLSAADILTQLITMNPSAAMTLTMDTAANIVAAIPGCVAGDKFPMFLQNVNATYAITLAGGTGVTMHGTLTLAASSGLTALVVLTNPATPAVDIYAI